jgi:hypothetical protein
VLERGEKIELLVDKTDRLSTQAFKFEKSVRKSIEVIKINRLTREIMHYAFDVQSRNLKQSMYCKKIKMYVLVFVVLGVSPSSHIAV